MSFWDAEANNQLEREAEIPLVQTSMITPVLVESIRLLSNKIERSWPNIPTLSAKMNSQAASALTLLLKSVSAHFRAALFLTRDQAREDTNWHPEYLLSVSLQTRTIVELLCTIVFLFEDLPCRLPLFQQDGWGKAVVEFGLYKEDMRAIGGRHEIWADGFEKVLAQGVEHFDITPEQQAAPYGIAKWPTPGLMRRYGLPDKTPVRDLPTTRQFLHHLYVTNYQPLSGEVHGNSYGLMRSGVLVLIEDNALVSEAQKAEIFHRLLGTRIVELFQMTLCVLTELQHFTGIDDLDLKARLHSVWLELNKVESVSDVFEMRYKDWFPFPIIGS